MREGGGGRGKKAAHKRGRKENADGGNRGGWVEEKTAGGKRESESLERGRELER